MSDNRVIAELLGKMASSLNLREDTLASYRAFAQAYLSHKHGTLDELITDEKGLETLIRQTVSDLATSAKLKAVYGSSYPVKTPAFISPPGAGKTAGITAVLNSLKSEGKIADYMMYDMLKHNRTTSPLAMVGGVGVTDEYTIAGSEESIEQLQATLDVLAGVIANELVGAIGKGDANTLKEVWSQILRALYGAPLVLSKARQDIASSTTGPLPVGSILAICLYQTVVLVAGEAGVDTAQAMLSAIGRKLWDNLSNTKKGDYFGSGGDVVDYGEGVKDGDVLRPSIKVEGMGKPGAFVSDELAKNIANKIVSALGVLESAGAGVASSEGVIYHIPSPALQKVLHAILSRGGYLSRIVVPYEEASETFSRDDDSETDEGLDSLTKEWELPERAKTFAKAAKGVELLRALFNPHLPIRLGKDKDERGIKVVLPLPIMEFIKQARGAYEVWKQNVEIKVERNKDSFGSTQSVVVSEVSPCPIYVLFLDEFFNLLSRTEASVITALWRGFLNRDDMFSPNLLLVLAGNAPEKEFFDQLQAGEADERALSPDQVLALFERLEVRFLLPSHEYLTQVLTPKDTLVVRELSEVEEEVDKPDVSAVKERTENISRAFLMGVEIIRGTFEDMMPPIEYSGVLDFLARQDAKLHKEFAVLRIIDAFLNRGGRVGSDLLSALGTGEDRDKIETTLNVLSTIWNEAMQEGWGAVQGKYGLWSRDKSMSKAIDAYVKLTAPLEFAFWVLADARRILNQINVDMIRAATRGTISTENLEDYMQYTQPGIAEYRMTLADVLALSTMRLLSMRGVEYDKMKKVLDGIDSPAITHMPRISPEEMNETYKVSVSQSSILAYYIPDLTASPTRFLIVKSSGEADLDAHEIFGRLSSVYNYVLDTRESLYRDTVRLMSFSAREFDGYVSNAGRHLAKYIASRYLLLHTVYGIIGSEGFRRLAGFDPLVALYRTYDFVRGFSLGYGDGSPYGLYANHEENGWTGTIPTGTNYIYPSFITRFFGDLLPYDSLGDGSQDKNTVLQALAKLYEQNRTQVLRTRGGGDDEVTLTIDVEDFKAKLEGQFSMVISPSSSALRGVIERLDDAELKNKGLDLVDRLVMLYSMSKAIARQETINIQKGETEGLVQPKQLTSEFIHPEVGFGYKITNGNYPLDYIQYGNTGTEEGIASADTDLQVAISAKFRVIADLAKYLNDRMGGLFELCKGNLLSRWAETKNAAYEVSIADIVGALYAGARDIALAFADGKCNVGEYEDKTLLKLVRMLDVLSVVYEVIGEGIDANALMKGLDNAKVEVGGVGGLHELWRTGVQVPGTLLYELLDAWKPEPDWNALNNAVRSETGKDAKMRVSGLPDIFTAIYTNVDYQTVAAEAQAEIGDDAESMVRELSRLLSKIVSFELADFQYTENLVRPEETDKMVYDTSTTYDLAGGGIFKSDKGKAIRLFVNNTQLFDIKPKWRDEVRKAMMEEGYDPSGVENIQLMVGASEEKSQLGRVKGNEVEKRAVDERTPKIAGLEDSLDVLMCLFADQYLTNNNLSSGKGSALAYLLAYFAMRADGFSLYWGKKNIDSGKVSLIGYLWNKIKEGKAGNVRTGLASATYALAGFYLKSGRYDQKLLRKVDYRDTILSYTLGAAAEVAEGTSNES